MLHKTNILVIFILFTIGCVNLPETTAEKVEGSPTATIDIDATVMAMFEASNSNETVTVDTINGTASTNTDSRETDKPLEQYRKNQLATKEMIQATQDVRTATRATAEAKLQDEKDAFLPTLKSLDYGPYKQETTLIPSSVDQNVIVSSDSTPEPASIWIAPWSRLIWLESSIPLRKSDLTVTWGIQEDEYIRNQFYIKGEIKNSSSTTTKSVDLHWKRYDTNGYASDNNVSKWIRDIRPGDTTQFELMLFNEGRGWPDFKRIVLFEFNVYSK